MSDIFNNKSNNQTVKPQPTAKSVGDLPADIKEYKDQENISLRKMKIGLWLVENRPVFIKIFYGILIAVSIVTWSIFVWTFGSYVISGMQQDEKNAAELVKSEGVHNILPAIKARPLEYGAFESISTADGKIDLVAEVRNPNDKYWAELTYYFLLDGKELGRSSSFLLPGEKKYLLALGQSYEGSAGGAELKIEQVKWRLLNAHEFPDWDKFQQDRLNIEITDKKFTPAHSTILTEKINLNECAFTAINNTAFNYREARFIIVLFSNGRIIGANKYIFDNFLSGDKKEVKVTWLGRLDNVDEIYIAPDINILNNDIYLKFEGEPTGNVPRD